MKSRTYVPTAAITPSQVPSARAFSRWSSTASSTATSASSGVSPPEERDLLDVAACWGYEFDPGVIGEVLGLGRIPTLKHFGHIEREHRLVRGSGRSYVFDHHQVQEALYGSLHEQMREEYHSALAEALEVRTKAAEVDPETLDGVLCVDLAEQFLLGALRAAGGDAEAGRASLIVASDLAGEIGVPGTETLARCHLAVLPGGDAEDAISAFTERAERLYARERLEARWLLFRATGDAAHLTEAKRLLDEATANVDEETRASMLENLRLNREIMSAWRETSADGSLQGDDDRHPGRDRRRTGWCDGTSDRRSREDTNRRLVVQVVRTGTSGGSGALRRGLRGEPGTRRASDLLDG
ncbi:MAG: hypothetical protein GF400_02565 [Candidatus Eisenbacteria bacterium]|nr:hypothetical protein [Candidatus Eisenbacteria bacterium]